MILRLPSLWIYRDRKKLNPKAASGRGGEFTQPRNLTLAEPCIRGPFSQVGYIRIGSRVERYNARNSCGRGERERERESSVQCQRPSRLRDALNFMDGSIEMELLNPNNSRHLQSTSERLALGCVNTRPGCFWPFTQPRTSLFERLCTRYSFLPCVPTATMMSNRALLHI